ncbi:Phasin protein [Sulfitobacter marinus]|uniref:Phasin protein n=1 Tax=Sulfitobacter marinus TaxID=394264 RepID=A0A1I6VBN3_9RHOB|nr:phasin family protein [Sulfitobacter marinus]SFT11121.1 Phasin protein [Sulfitobacter marinus]
MSTTEKPTDLAPSMVKLMKSMQGNGLHAPSISGADWMEAMIEMGNEMLNFTADRIKEDVDTQQKLLKAKEITDVQKIQTAFFQKAMDDYAAEYARLLDIGKSLMDKPQAHTVPV